MNSIIESPVGELLTSADSQGRITGLHFLSGDAASPGAASYARNHPRAPRAGTHAEEPPPALRELHRQLAEYFAGERREFELELAPAGTAFQRAVWDALRAIPYGETASYLEIGRAVGKVQAARAVGQANNRNPIAIVIPCHRVVNADGKLGGYGGGVWRKQALLELERGERRYGENVEKARDLTIVMTHISPGSSPRYARDGDPQKTSEGMLSRHSIPDNHATQ